MKGNHLTDIRVRYADTDQMSIAYNGEYLAWFEVARTEMLRDTGFTYDQMEKDGFFLPVIEAGIKYLKPARYDDVLTIETIVEKNRGIRIRIEYIVWRGDEKLATGFTEHVFTDCNLKPAKPTKELRAILHPEKIINC